MLFNCSVRLAYKQGVRLKQKSDCLQVEARDRDHAEAIVGKVAAYKYPTIKGFMISGIKPAPQEPIAVQNGEVAQTFPVKRGPGRPRKETVVSDAG